MTVVSLVIPAFGACDWLDETIGSIAAQTLAREALEVIIVTDGGSEEVVAGARARLERKGVRAVVVIDRHCSLAAARNRGWRLASGEWIQFVDCGDRLAPDKLELQTRAISRLSAPVDVVCSGWQRLTAWRGRWQPFGPTVWPEPVEPVVLRLVLPLADSLGPMLLRKQVIERAGGFSAEVEFCASQHLLLKIADVGGRFAEARSALPLYFMREAAGERSRAQKIGVACQQLENLLEADAILRRQAHGRLPAEQAEELAILRRVRLTELYWQEPAAFARYSQPPPEPAMPADRNAEPEPAASSTRRNRLPGARDAVARRTAAAASRIADGAEATAGWAHAGLVAAAGAVVGSGSWVARLAARAGRRLACVVGAVLSWTAAVVSAAAWTARRIAAVMHALFAVVRWLVLRPVVAGRRIAADVAEVARWIWAGVLGTERALVRAASWVAGAAMFFAQIAAAGVAAARRIGRAVARAAALLARTVRHAVRLTLGVFRSAAAGLAAAAARLASGVVFAARALLHGALQVACLPVRAWRRLRATAARAAARLAHGFALAAESVARAARAIWTLPSRLVVAAASSVSPTAGPGLKRAGALLVMMGAAGLIGVAALDPLGRAVRTGRRPLSPVTAEAVSRPQRTAPIVMSSMDRAAAREASKVEAGDIPVPAAKLSPPVLETRAAEESVPPPPPANRPEAISQPGPSSLPSAGRAEKADAPSGAAQSKEADAGGLTPPVSTTERRSAAVASPAEDTDAATAGRAASPAAAPASRDQGPAQVGRPPAPAAKSEEDIRVAEIPSVRPSSPAMPVAADATAAADDDKAAVPVPSPGPAVAHPAGRGDDAPRPENADAEAPRVRLAVSTPSKPDSAGEPPRYEPAAVEAPAPAGIIDVSSDSPGSTSAREAATPTVDHAALPPPDRQAPSPPQAEPPAAVVDGAAAPERADQRPASEVAPPSPGAQTEASASRTATVAATPVDEPRPAQRPEAAQPATETAQSAASVPNAPVADSPAMPAAAAAVTSPEPAPTPAVPPGVEAPPAAQAATGAERVTPAPAPQPAPLDPAEKVRAEKLLARGERDLANGNVAQARLFFLHAAKAGLARGALLLGGTYDTHQLARMTALGIQPNAALARTWYQRARELGAVEADERLSALATPGTPGAGQ